MDLHYSVERSISVEINKELAERMIEENVDISSIYEIARYVDNEIIDEKLFITDEDDYELFDYELNKEEKELFKKLKYEIEKDLPLKNQLDLFGGIVC